MPEAVMRTVGQMLPNAAPRAVGNASLAEARELLLQLWARNLPGTSSERFDWLYSSGRSQAWLLEGTDGSVIGSAGRLRRRLAIEGRVVEAGVPIDLNVDQRKRTLGPALALVREVAASAQREGLALNYAIPLRAAEVVLKLARYQPIGVMSNWTKLLRSEFKLRRLLRSSWAARVAAPLADVSMRLRDARIRSRLPRDVATETPAGFDQRFDRLWLNTLSRFQVIGERTAEFLTWRFLNCPQTQYHIFTLVQSKSRELLGYVIWSAAADSVSIADLLASDSSTTTRLLWEFIELIRGTGAAAIRLSCFASDEFYRALRAAGLSQRQDGLTVLVKTLDTMGNKSTATDNGQNWYLTMADHDVGS